MQRFRTFFLMLLLAGLAIAPATAQSTWFKQHQGDTNNAVLNINAQVTNFDGGFTWQTGDQKLLSTGGITIHGGTCFTISQTGGDTYGVLTDDHFTVKAFNAETGSLTWESPALDAGRSVDMYSNSTPTVDPADKVLYIGTGAAMQKLDLTSGALLKSVKLDSTNTSATAGSYDIINSCPTLGVGLVFIETYGGMDTNVKQLVALRQSDLGIAWYKSDKGVGTGAPCFVDSGSTQRVYSAVSCGIACYDATTGNQVWRSDKLATSPWSTTNDIFASLVYDNGCIYAVTNSWGTAGEVLCADAATGELKWKIDTQLSSSVPPVIIGDVAYVQGGGWGDTHLGAHSISQKGKELFSVPTGGNSYNTFMAATNDRLYMTDGSNLLVIDPAVILADKTKFSDAIKKISGAYPNSYDGAVILDGKGGVYVHCGSGLKAFGQTVPVTLSRFVAE